MLEEAQPGQPLKAADVRRLARTVRRSTPGRSADGDAAPGSLTQLGTGAASSTSDHGKTFFVQITGLGPVVDGRQSYTFKEVGIRFNSSETLQTVQIDDGGIQADAQTPAFPVDPDHVFAVDDYAIARRSRRSIYCWELVPAVDGGTYVLAATSTADSKGRYTSNEDTYDPDTDTWTTSKADILAEPAVGVTMQQGLRYPAWPTTDPGVFTTIGDANEIIVSSVPVYFGGLNNTTNQVFKGEKQYRDRTTWAWKSGSKEHSYIQTNSMGETRHLWQGNGAYAELDLGGWNNRFWLVDDGRGMGYVEGNVVGCMSGGDVAEMFHGGGYSGLRLNYTYLRAGTGVGSSPSPLECLAPMYLRYPPSATVPFYGIERDFLYDGIDVVYDPTTHGLLILGGIVVGTWDLSKSASSLPTGGPMAITLGGSANPYQLAMVAIGTSQQSYLDSFSDDEMIYQDEFALILESKLSPINRYIEDQEDQIDPIE